MDKYKMIICDDAAIIRKNLVGLVTAHFPNIDIVGVYADGDEAIRHLEQDPVDLLIADIRMERVDGLKIAEYVYVNKLHTRFIIITGFQEFEYARQAVNYHVSALITKPIDSSLLVRALQDSVKALDIMFDRINTESQQKLKDHKQIAQAIRLFIEGGVRPDMLSRSIPDSLPFARCKKAMLLNALLSPESRPIDAGTWDELIPHKMDGYEIYVLSGRERGACCLALDLSGSETAQETLDQIVSQLRQSVSSQHHRELETWLLPLSDVSKVFTTELFRDFAAYLQGIPEMNPERSKQRAAKIAANADIDTLRIMLSLMLIFARTQAPTLEVTFFATELCRLTHSSDGVRLMQRFNALLTDAIISNDAFVGIIRMYVYSNISDENLSLEMVSRHFGYSAEHFSRKFKQMTGSTFQSYLADVRMERAKELLSSTGNSIAWVSDHVGFKDPAYFSKVFKKHTGLLPKEYKNHIPK